MQFYSLFCEVMNIYLLFFMIKLKEMEMKLNSTLSYRTNTYWDALLSEKQNWRDRK